MFADKDYPWGLILAVELSLFGKPFLTRGFDIQTNTKARAFIC